MVLEYSRSSRLFYCSLQKRFLEFFMVVCKVCLHGGCRGTKDSNRMEMEGRRRVEYGVRIFCESKRGSPDVTSEMIRIRVSNGKTESIEGRIVTGYLRKFVGMTTWWMEDTRPAQQMSRISSKVLSKNSTKGLQ